MNDQESHTNRLRDVGLAVLLAALTYTGLYVATGAFPLITLPEEVTIPVYILLYSFLGSVAYLLSALLGEYKKLTDERTRLEVLEKDLKDRRDILKMKSAEIKKPEPLETLDQNLEKVRERLNLIKEDWIKLAEIWIKFGRIPFGMLMAAAFYLLAGQLVSEDILNALGPQVLSGIAFVVALFPKVMMEGLTGLAVRLMGLSGKKSSDLKF